MSEAKPGSLNNAEMSAPALAWVYRVGYPETDVLTTTDDVLVTALVRRYGGRWAVEIWTSRDDEDDAPEHRISRAILDIDVPRADPIPPAVLVAAEAWLREHVRGIAWPAEPRIAPDEDRVSRVVRALLGMADRANTARGASCEHCARSAGTLTDAAALIGELSKPPASKQQPTPPPDAQRDPVAGWLCEGGDNSLRDAKLAAEDAAAEVLRARVEALGYRMVRT